jgi:hypothetical protein
MYVRRRVCGVTRSGSVGSRRVDRSSLAARTAGREHPLVEVVLVSAAPGASRERRGVSGLVDSARAVGQQFLPQPRAHVDLADPGGGPVPVTRPATVATSLASGRSSRGRAGAMRGTPLSSDGSNACSLATLVPGPCGRFMVGSWAVEQGGDGEGASAMADAPPGCRAARLCQTLARGQTGRTVRP